jgi:hypothetical protein
MTKLEKVRLREPANVEDRLAWGTAFDAGDSVIEGRRYTTNLALDESGWVHIVRMTAAGATKRARVPPSMIRIIFDAPPASAPPPVTRLTVTPHPKSHRRPSDGGQAPRNEVNRERENEP